MATLEEVKAGFAEIHTEIASLKAIIDVAITFTDFPPRYHSGIRIR